MANIRFPGEKAWENIHTSDKNNRICWWNRRSSNPFKEYDDDAMISRLKCGAVLPRVPKKPLINKDSNVFAIGSCFARRIEWALHFKNISCLSLLELYAGFKDMYGKDPDFEYTIKYNTCSVLNELKWALDPETRFPEEALIRTKSGYRDMHIHGKQAQGADFTTKEEALDFHRNVISRDFRRIKDCKVVIITLGLIEAWFDNETGLYVNEAPSADMVQQCPGRFTFEVLDYNTNMKNLEEIYELLKKNCPPDFNIFVTVSPVPLTATFTERDVLIANTLSKSMLRTAAEEWAFKHKEIEYFPSYEMAINSSRELVWEDDAIHIRQEFAEKIMDLFLDTYAIK